jgi:pimeloyl-ACP methyl ester carboxylesterase
MASINVNGARLEYFENGTGEPLMLVHGSSNDYRAWKQQREELSKDFRTIVYSRRYHWPNAEIPIGKEYSMKEQLDDLEELVSSLNAAPANLIGHSYGAFLSLLLAIKNPQLVKSLILAEPPVITLFISNEPKPAEIIKMMFKTPLIGINIMKFGKGVLVPAKEAMKKNKIEEGMQIFVKGIFGDDAERIYEIKKEEAGSNLSNAKAELLGSGFLPIDENDLRKLQTPALLVAGSKTRKVFRLLIDRLQELLPNSERVVINNATHLMQEDNPVEFNRAVIEFLK